MSAFLADNEGRLVTFSLQRWGVRLCPRAPVDFTFVRQRFWFVVSKCRHAFTLQPRVCVFTCGLGFSAFLFLSHHNGGAKSSLCIIVQEQGRNQTLCMSRAGWGMFLSAASLLLFPDKA